MQHVVPSVGADEAELVRNLLADAGASVAYITSPDAARQAVAEIVPAPLTSSAWISRQRCCPHFASRFPSSSTRTETSPPDSPATARPVRPRSISF